jgi:tRNA A-37 threonylcarbamoyl transferase component Bud32
MTASLSPRLSSRNATRALGGERALADFTEAIEAHTMGPRLAAALRRPSATCHVLDAKLQPGVGATVLYDLDGHLVRGDLHPVRGALQPTGATVVAPGVLLSPFPRDPDLVSLPAVMDPAGTGPALATALGLPPSAGATATGSRWRTTLVRYRPGKRATVLVTDRARHQTYFAKVYHDPDKAAAVANEAHALQSAALSAAVLRFAPIVAHLPDLRTVVHSRVAGTPLHEVLGSRNGPTRAAGPAVRRAARAVAALHEASPPTTRTRSVERELHRFVHRATAISDVAPRPGHALLRLAERVADHVGHLVAPEVGTVHGDCKPSQFLLAPHEVYLLDVDHVGVSDVATDAGTFLASLRQLAVRWPGNRSDSVAAAYDDLADAFLQEYLQVRGSTPDVDRIRWQEAVALERKALRAFARAPGSPLVEALTTEAHRCLDRLGAGRVHG